MEWLTQNWILVAFAVGAVLLMRRSGMGCGHAGGGHHRGAQHGQHHGRNDSGAPSPPAQTTDPVTGRSVEPGSAIASVYRGVPIYFESRENRDRFEAAPEEFPIVQASANATPDKRPSHC